MCCGGTRPASPRPPATARRPMAGMQGGTAASINPVFEYVGATALTVVSPITRKTYRFEQPGARVTVDARDRSWVAFVPSLARVGS